MPLFIECKLKVFNNKTVSELSQSKKLKLFWCHDVELRNGANLCNDFKIGHMKSFHPMVGLAVNISCSD